MTGVDAGQPCVMPGRARGCAGPSTFPDTRRPGLRARPPLADHSSTPAHARPCPQAAGQPGSDALLSLSSLLLQPGNNHVTHPFCFSVILSPSDSAMPCVFERMRMYPASLPSSCFSTLTFTSASSPNTDLAYRLAAR